MAVSPRHVAIVGGGIAGLATAYALRVRSAEAEVPLACSVIEAAPRWGGKISTHTVSGLVIEAGPDSFLSTKPWALDLCRRLALDEQVINTNPLADKAFVFSRGRLRPLPEGLVMMVPTRMGPFLRSGLLSWTGMARMAMELVIPRRRETDEDESLAAFFRRRLGREAFERLIEPLMAGIYAGDAERLSLRATFPRFAQMERRYGSVLRAVMAERTAAGREAEPRTMFVTLRDGLHTLITALVMRLEKEGTRLSIGRRVTALRGPAPGEPGYVLSFDDGGIMRADAVVLATPAYVSADLVRSLDAGAADLLSAIPYASTATVSLAYHRSDLGGAVTGFGFVVPRVERRDLLAATWTSQKWSHRAPSTHALVRCYVGGVGRGEILYTDDQALAERVRHELREIAGITASPTYVEVNRWDRGMPQYTVGHLERLDRIQAALRPYEGLYLTGAGYRGIGIPDCIRDGAETAERVVRDLMAVRS